MIALGVLLTLTLLQTAPSGQGSAGLCEIRGRITDRETGLPISGAVIALTSAGGKESRRTTADRDGRYQFTALPPGEYAVFSGPGDFRATHARTVVRPYPMSLKAGEVREQVDAALARTRAITVRAIDDLGEPLSRISVTLKSASGRVIRVGRTTDDRGRVRLFNLEPGRYTVCADVSQFGGASSSAQPERFLRTCYPSVASETDAEPVVLGNSDLEGIEIRMRRGRTYTVSGTVVDSTGAPPPPIAVIGLSHFEPGSSTGFGGRLEPDGRFTFKNVVPGEYAVEISIGGPERPEHRRGLESAFVPVHVFSADVTDVFVQTALTAQVAGRLVLEDSSASLPSHAGYGPILIWSRLVGDPTRGSGSMRSTWVHEDHVFYLGGLLGPRRLDVVNVPPGWYVKAIRYGTRDITDRPTVFKNSDNPSNLEIVLSTKGATLSGKVVDDRGEGAAGAHILVLPIDPERWSAGELSNVSASKVGAFKIGPFRRGDYSIVALSSSIQLPDPMIVDGLMELARKGERVSLSENEERTIDLRLMR